VNSAVEDLRLVFGDPQVEGYTTTGKVMILPSGVTKDLASQAIEQIDLSIVMRDIGMILAREIANELERMALRPADYVDLPDMPQMVAARVAGELAAAPPEFLVALLDHIRLRG
jgi:hypothetical protein